MRFLKYLIVTILLLTPIESIMAACSDWSASNIISPNKPLVIKYYVTLYSVYNDSYSGITYYHKYRGFNKKNEPGEFYFDVPYGEPIKLALTGSDNYGTKIFLKPARENINAFFDPDSFFRSEEQLLGGYFYPEIWEFGPKEGKRLRCIRKKGSNVLLSLEEAKNFKPSPTTHKPSSADKKLKDLISSKKGFKPKRPKDRADKFSSGKSSTPLTDLSSSIKKDNSTPSSDLGKDKRKLKYTNPTPSPDYSGKDKVKSDVMICDNKLEKLNYHFPNIHSPITVMGLLKSKQTQAYWFDTGNSILFPHEFNFVLSSIVNKFVVVEIPYTKDKIAKVFFDKKNKKSEIFPVRFNGIANVPKVSAKTKAIPPYDMNILVVGDASSIAVSGLEQMERILTKESRHKFYWTIDWRNISANGKWQTSEKVDSFAKLVRNTKLVDGKKVLLTKDSNFKNFINDFEKTVLKAEKRIDFIIWVKHGYQVPLKTPVLIGKLISNIHDKGNIPRNSSSRNPQKWLYIISGSMPGKSKALLEEPITRAISRPGYVEEEKTIRSPRRLLNSPKSLAGMLYNTGMRYVKPSPKFDFDKESLAVDANQAFYNLGLLISTKVIGDLLSSVRKLKSMTTKFSGIYDPTVLINIQSNKVGKPKQLVVKDKRFATRNIHKWQKDHKDIIDIYITEATEVLKNIEEKLGSSRCTHLYIKDTEIGLNWLVD